MFASYKINLSTISSGSTATTINIPIVMDYQLVDQADLIQTKFVDVETEKAINPILDYEKVRFLPLDLSNNQINKITYILNLSGATTYSDIGFTNDDLRFQRNNFIETFINLSFYDTDNPLDQRLISFITLFSEITQDDLLPNEASQIAIYGSVIGIPGQAKPANDKLLSFSLTSPLLSPRGIAEGYHLYDYKDELVIGDFKYLYMKASFKNAKTSKSINLMVEPNPSSIDQLIHKLYTRYKLFRTMTGFYYEIDDTYHGDGSIGQNNVQYVNNNVNVNLYQIQAL